MHCHNGDGHCIVTVADRDVPTNSNTGDSNISYNTCKLASLTTIILSRV